MCNSMKRKIVLHGPATMTVSLPSKWIKRLGVRKGDELTVIEYGNELRITPDEVKATLTKELDIKDLKRVGKSFLTSSYRQGADEITLTYNDTSYIQVIQEILSKELTGFEIIRQNSNSCTIKDLTGHSVDEFDNVLRRIWLLVTDLSKELKTLIESSAYGQTARINLVDSLVNKFSNYCLRSLVKKPLPERKPIVLSQIVRKLEKISDHYKDFYNFMSKNNKKPDRASILIFENINEHLEELYKAFYKYDVATFEVLFDKNKELTLKLSKMQSEGLFYLSLICTDIKDLFSLTIELSV